MRFRRFFADCRRRLFHFCRLFSPDAADAFRRRQRCQPLMKPVFDCHNAALTLRLPAAMLFDDTLFLLAAGRG